MNGVYRTLDGEKTFFMDWPCGIKDLSEGDMLYLRFLCAEDYKKHRQKCFYAFEDAEYPVPLKIFHM